MSVSRLKGFPGFLVLWMGQAFSILGGAMSVFAVGLWIYQKTGEATPVALVGFFTLAPITVVGLFAGALVDRYDRRLMMALGDLASLVVCVLLILGSSTGTIQLWWIYTAAAVLGTFQSFQWPATSAAVTVMVDKKHYGRVASLLEMAGLSSGILAPLLAGALLGFIGLPGILMLTAAGSLVALLSLLVIDLPAKAPGPRMPLTRLFLEIGEGIGYVLARPPLIAVQTTFLVGNFLSMLSLSLLGPMVLGQTANNSLAFASVETAGALGGLVGAALLAAWGGMKNKVLGVLAGWSFNGLLGLMVVGFGPHLGWWLAGAFLGQAAGSLNYVSNQALWQSKVPVDLQGRVFSVRRLIGMGVMPLASLASGPLADRVLEPAMRTGGSLALWLGPVFGTGPGSGIRVMFACCGIALALVGPLAWAVPTVRNAEKLLPDAAH